MTQPPTIPRSPYVTALILRTENPTPANDVFPPAYINDGRDLDEALASLGLERAPIRVPQNTLGEVIIFSALYVGLIAALSAAVWFALQQLSAVGSGAVQ